tara:strand:+ start:1421 stop:2491 length:1071 start_codon:yes stop_codon:yes gene_type:complete
MEKVIITFGTYDLLHVGHINILKRAKEQGSKLIVGVSSDWLTLTKKGIAPIESEEIRMKNVKDLEYVDNVFLEESLEDKALYITNHNASLLIMGDDWSGNFDNCPCEVKYLPRTPDISSTQLKQELYPNRDSCISKMLHLPGTYKHPDTPSNEIFPLKKYDFYGYEIYGPKNYNTMENYYSKLAPMMTHSNIKWQKGIKKNKYRGVFKLENVEPAEYTYGKTFDTQMCNENTKACIHQNNRTNSLIETKNGLSIRPCCRHRLNNMLIDFTAILKENKIPYFIYWGTLLGIVRHNGSIPWDFDHDLYILDSFKKSFLKLVPSLSKKYFVEMSGKNLCRINVSYKNRAHIDVMFVENK